MDYFEYLPFAESKYPPYIDPIAFTLGTLDVAWYGIMVFFGFMLAIGLSIIKLKYWYKVPVEPAYWFCFIAIPIAILGARTWSFIIGDAKVAADSNFFVDFWKFDRGGMAIQGGVIAVMVAALIYFPLILTKPNYSVRTSFKGKQEVKQISTFVYADAVMPTVLVGQAIGRWGNMFNQEIYGSIVDNPEQSFGWLKTIFPTVYEQMFISSDGIAAPLFRQPLFLYESFANIIFFLILWVGMEFFYRRKAGDLAAGYFIGYSIIRLIMEPLRSSQYEFVTTIVITVLMMVAGIIFIILNHLIFAKNRDKKTLFKVYMYVKLFFKIIKYQFSSKYKKYIDTNFPNFKNFGEKKKISFKRDRLLYYNGV